MIRLKSKAKRLRQVHQAYIIAPQIIGIEGRIRERDAVPLPMCYSADRSPWRSISVSSLFQIGHLSGVSGISRKLQPNLQPRYRPHSRASSANHCKMRN
jgi:hypothetical protein